MRRRYRSKNPISDGAIAALSLLGVSGAAAAVYYATKPTTPIAPVQPVSAPAGPVFTQPSIHAGQPITPPVVRPVYNQPSIPAGQPINPVSAPAPPLQVFIPNNNFTVQPGQTLQGNMVLTPNAAGAATSLDATVIASKFGLTIEAPLTPGTVQNAFWVQLKNDNSIALNIPTIFTGSAYLAPPASPNAPAPPVPPNTTFAGYFSNVQIG